MSVVPVTILMTVRNGESFVEETVSSILNQTFGDFKFLILDNASSDRTREIIRSYRDPRIGLVGLGRDIGQTAALNRGLVLSNTPYVARTDADDISHPDRLQRQMDFATKHPEIALIGTWYEIIDSRGTIVSKRRPPCKPDQLSKQILLDNPFAHSSVLLNRLKALECGGYNPAFSFAQDYALWIEIASGSPAAILPEFLVQIRRHGKRSTADPSVAFQRAREAMVAVLGKANRSVDRGKIEAHACLRYATVAKDTGQVKESLNWLKHGISQDPSMLFYKMPTIAPIFLRAVVSDKGFTALRRVRRLFLQGTA
mgnify:CR=1 FL=1